MVLAAIDVSNSLVVGPMLEHPAPPEVIPEKDIHPLGPDSQHFTPDKEPVSI